MFKSIGGKPSLQHNSALHNIIIMLKLNSSILTKNIIYGGRTERQEVFQNVVWEIKNGG